VEPRSATSTCVQNTRASTPASSSCPAGIAQSIKLTTEKSSTRIAEFGFAYAKRNGRRASPSSTKANIMKISDGLALDCARRVARGTRRFEIAG